MSERGSFFPYPFSFKHWTLVSSGAWGAKSQKRGVASDQREFAEEEAALTPPDFEPCEREDDVKSLRDGAAGNDCEPPPAAPVAPAGSSAAGSGDALPCPPAAPEAAAGSSSEGNGNAQTTPVGPVARAGHPAQLAAGDDGSALPDALTETLPAAPAAPVGPRAPAQPLALASGNGNSSLAASSSGPNADTATQQFAPANNSGGCSGAGLGSGSAAARPNSSAEGSRDALPRPPAAPEAPAGSSAEGSDNGRANSAAPVAPHGCPAQLKPCPWDDRLEPSVALSESRAGTRPAAPVTPAAPASSHALAQVLALASGSGGSSAAASLSAPAGSSGPVNASAAQQLASGGCGGAGRGSGSGSLAPADATDDAADGRLTTRWRLGFGSFNFGGERCAKNKDEQSNVLCNLATSPAALLCAQELTERQASELRKLGWLCAEPVEGVTVLGKNTRVTDVTVLHTITVHKERKCSKAMVALATLAHPHFGFNSMDQRLPNACRGTAGGEMRSLALASAHLHNEVAKVDGETRKEFFRQLTAAVVHHHCRVLAGDFNMAAYAVIEIFAAAGIQATLCAYHVEMKGSSGGGVLLYDSCGIWALGPLEHPWQCSPEHHIFRGAVHPMLMDKTGTADMGLGTRIHRGYEAKSYCKPGPPTFSVSNETMELCRRIGLSAGFTTNPPCGGEGVKRPPPRLAHGVGVKTCSADLDGGFALAKHQSETRVKASTLPADNFEATKLWCVWPTAMEICADGTIWDPTGNAWGRGAHWPLFVNFGTKRERTEKSKQQKAAKKAETRRRAPALAGRAGRAAAQQHEGSAATAPALAGAGGAAPAAALAEAAGAGAAEAERGAEPARGAVGRWQAFDGEWWWFSDRDRVWYDERWRPFQAP